MKVFWHLTFRFADQTCRFNTLKTAFICLKLVFGWTTLSPAPHAGFRMRTVTMRAAVTDW